MRQAGVLGSCRFDPFSILRAGHSRLNVFSTIDYCETSPFCAMYNVCTIREGLAIHTGETAEPAIQGGGESPPHGGTMFPIRLKEELAL